MKHIKSIVSLLLALMLALSLTACGSQANTEPEQPDDTPTAAEVNLYVLSGPTGIGAMNLWAAADAGETENTYHITMSGANDEVVAAISKGEADIAAVATNMAAALYNKTEGGVTVLAVNTLGVLSLLGNGQEAATIADLAGKTIYAPGQGANPEYILRYVLTGNGLDPDKDVTIQFVGEGSELLTVWQSDPDAVILAPQPVATSILMQNENAAKLFDMTEEWSKISGNQLMMGCVIVRNAFLQENPGAVELFLKEYAASIEKAQTDVEGTAALCEQYGLIPKAALAQKAIPSCGLTFVTGAEMKTDLSAYLQVMYDADPKSVGGVLPGDDFYYGASGAEKQHSGTILAARVAAGGYGRQPDTAATAAYAGGYPPGAAGAGGYGGLLAGGGTFAAAGLRRVRAGGAGGHAVRRRVRPVEGVPVADRAAGGADPGHAGGGVHHCGVPVGGAGLYPQHHRVSDGAAHRMERHGNGPAAA